MKMMREVKIVVRRDCVDEVVVALRDADIPRFHVSHVHVLGAGVDPEDSRLSLEEGTRYTEKSKIEVFCRQADVQRVIEIVREHAATGHRGDGVMAVTPIERIVSIRTGEEDVLAVV